MQRKRYEDGGLAGRDPADLRRKPSRPQQKPSRLQPKPSQHSTFFAKIAIFIECWDGLEAPTTTKVPVPFVVVPNNGYAETLALRRLRIVWITMSSSNSTMATTTMSTANSRLPQWRPASDFCLSTSFLLYLVRTQCTSRR